MSLAIAAVLREHEELRRVVRGLLWPAVWVSRTLTVAAAPPVMLPRLRRGYG
jgi:hypothetical protein